MRLTFERIALIILSIYTVVSLGLQIYSADRNIQSSIDKVNAAEKAKTDCFQQIQQELKQQKPPQQQQQLKGDVEQKKNKKILTDADVEMLGAEDESEESEGGSSKSDSADDDNVKVESINHQPLSKQEISENVDAVDSKVKQMLGTSHSINGPCSNSLSKSNSKQRNSTIDFDDILNDYVNLAAFPGKPLHLKQMYLCDPENNIVFPVRLFGRQNSHAWVCPEDPTCMTCRGEYVKAYDALLAAWRHKETTEERDRLLDKWLPKQNYPGEHTIVSFALNKFHTPLFLNWACTSLDLGLDVRKFTVVAPTDEFTYDTLVKFGFNCLPPHGWLKKVGRVIDDHVSINHIAHMIANDLIQKRNYSLLIQDADIAWIKNPIPFLREAVRRRDMIFMISPYWEPKGTANTGFIFMSPTFKSKIFLQTIENVAGIKDMSDQVLWNTVMRHYFFHQLEWRILPQEFFFKHQGSKEKHPFTEKTMVFHAVSGGKIHKFRDYDLWKFTPQCPFWDEEAQKNGFNY